MSTKLQIDGSVLDYKEEKILMDVTGNTIRECLDQAILQKTSLKESIFDEKGGLRPGNFFKKNGQYLYSEPLAVPVKDGDNLDMLKFKGC